jgi:hypothetical protein
MKLREPELLHAEMHAIRRHGLGRGQLEDALEHVRGVRRGFVGTDDLQPMPAPPHLDAEPLLDVPQVLFHRPGKVHETRVVRAFE